MPLLRTMPLVYNYSFIQTQHFFSFIPNPLLLRTLFSTAQALYSWFIPCTTWLSHPPTAATCDHRYLSQFTSSNGSPLSITCIRPPFPYLERLITFLLTALTLNYLLSHTPPNSLTSLNNFSSESTTIVLYHQQITAGLSQTCDHSHSAAPALFQAA